MVKYSSGSAASRSGAMAFMLLSLIFIFFCNFNAAEAGTVGIRDDMNRNVILPNPAVRIVSLSQAHTENLVAVRAAGQLAGINYSADTKWVPKRVPRLSRVPDAEQIAGTRPDLVLFDMQTARKNAPLLKELGRLKIPYAVLNRPIWAGFAAYLDKLCTLSGREKDAQRASLAAEKSLYKASLRAGNRKRPSVFVLAASDYSTCAPSSWGARLITAAGGAPVNAAGAQEIADYPHFVVYGPQKFYAESRKVDVIITIRNNERGTPSISKEDVLKDPRLKNCPAVKNGRVFEIDEAELALPSIIRLDKSLVTVWEFLFK